MKVQILIDNPQSWMVPYAREWVSKFPAKVGTAVLVHTTSEVEAGDVLFLLSCEKKFTKYALNSFNLVCHASKLPEGKGWSPSTWQILEGKNKIDLTLFEATNEIDSGAVYFQDVFELDGTELVEEWQQKLANAIVRLMNRFVEMYPNAEATPQSGSDSFYRKRTPADSELDINKTIAEQFNLLRVVDNEKYPAFFLYQGQKYILKVFKGEDHE